MMLILHLSETRVHRGLLRYADTVHVLHRHDGVISHLSYA
jgi:hypothetical protein